MERYEIGC